MTTLCLLQLRLSTCINSFHLYNDSMMWVTISACGSQSPSAGMEDSHETLLHEKL